MQALYGKSFIASYLNSLNVIEDERKDKCPQAETEKELNELRRLNEELKNKVRKLEKKYDKQPYENTDLKLKLTISKEENMRLKSELYVEAKNKYIQGAI